MSRIANRIASLSGTARAGALGVAVAGCFAFAGGQALAQASDTAPAKPPAPETFSGCVQKAPGSSTDLVMSTPSACARLAGNVHVDELVGHQVDLKGVLTPRSGSAAASIQVDSVVSVGKSCSDVCSLRPPGSRGLHPPKDGAVPGSEGGTPGAAAPPP
jgi:hypothetical protein